MTRGVHGVSLGPQSFVFQHIHLFLLGALFGFFRINRLLGLFIFFEKSAVLIFIMVLAWGYQPERVLASLRLLIYTAARAIPLLIRFLLLKHLWGISQVVDLLSLRSQKNIKGLLGVRLTLGFIVKFPVYGLHLWLPQAHVEASAGGSILLAGVLLKMGGYGLYLVRPLLPALQGYRLAAWCVATSARVRLLCLRQRDIKLLIAYSSIAHMRLVVATLTTKTNLGLSASIFIMLAHGVRASLRFFLTGELYNWSRRRQLYINQSLLSSIPLLRMVWFLSAVANIGTPPTANFWGELLALFVLVPKRRGYVFFLSVGLFLGAAYTILLYGAIHRGQSPIGQLHRPTFPLKTFICRGVHVVFRLLLILLFSLV